MLCLQGRRSDEINDRTVYTLRHILSTIPTDKCITRWYTVITVNVWKQPCTRLYDFEQIQSFREELLSNFEKPTLKDGAYINEAKRVICTI